MRNRLVMKYPASWHGDMWREGVPAGNGLLGALVYGGIAREIVMVTHAALWHGSRTQKMPDVSHVLPEMRRLLAQDDPVAAERLMQQEFARLGYAAENGKPLPLCDLVVDQSSRLPFRRYRRELDMATGEIAVSWNDGEERIRRSLFVSRADDTIYYRIAGEGGDRFDAALSLALHDPETRIAPKGPADIAASATDGFLQFAARNDDGTDFGAVARVLCDGTVVHEGGAMKVTGASRIDVALRVFLRGDRTRDLLALSSDLSVYDGDYPRALSLHETLHRPLFEAMKFDLSASDRGTSAEEMLLSAYQGESPLALLEKMWSMGRYLLISSSRAGGLPCHLLGLWLGDWRAFWAIYMFNVNLEMMYWQALSGNLPDLLLPVFEYLEDRMDDFREYARKAYGCRGILISSVSTPESGLPTCLLPHILHWTGAAAWMSQHWYDYYLHTGDEMFLRTRALPFMEETARFYEDFLTVGPDGFLVASPSNSPENTPANIERLLGRKCEVTVNATMDFALVKELLTHLLEGSERCGLYEERRETWRGMLARIPPYQVNSHGAVAEWMHPFYEDNDEHRHLSHLYPLFPGTEVTRDGDPALYAAFVAAVGRRRVVGMKDQSGWSSAYMANIYARIGDAQHALECLDNIARTTLLRNLFTVHNDWRRMGVAVCGDFRAAPVQLDAIMGVTAAMQEMVMYSTRDTVFAMQAIPDSWTRGEVGPMLAKGRIEVVVSWNRAEGRGRISLWNRGASTTRTVSLPVGCAFDGGDGPSVRVDLPGEGEVELGFRMR